VEPPTLAKTARVGHPAYEKMGSPKIPTRAPILELRKAGAMPEAREESIKNGEVTLTLQPHALALVEVEK
jgi:hypothetical protein